jgi:hypothetical protein
MPIRSRPHETNDSMTLHPVADVRLGRAEDGMSTTGPEDLLPSGALRAPAPVAAPARALALDALRISRALRDPARRPARWAHPGFSAEVELIRRHLAPVRTRKSLAASFGREAFHVLPVPAERDDPSPIRLAYALRWMELGDGATGPSWTSLLD